MFLTQGGQMTAIITDNSPGMRSPPPLHPHDSGPLKELTLRLDWFHYEVGEMSNFVWILEGNYVT